MSEHAKLSASAAARWMTCTAAPALEATMSDTSSPYAEVGSLAHAIAETELSYRTGKIKKSAYTRRMKTHTEELINFYGGHETSAREAQNHIDEYVSQVMAIAAQYEDPYIELEQRVDFSAYVPEGFGTADVVIISEPHIHVIDLKFGENVAVSAVENPQLMLYGLGAYLKYNIVYDFDKVAVTIIQPRMYDISTYELPVGSLLYWADQEVRPKAAEAFSGNGAFVPSDKACKFCRASKPCKARAEWLLTQAAADFSIDALEGGAFEALDTIEGVRDKTGEVMSAEEIAAVLSHAGRFKAWYNAVEEYALTEARDCGVKYPGFKLVEGRSSRVIPAAGTAMVRLTDGGIPEDDFLTPRSLLGITALEKNVGKKKLGDLIGDLITKPPGKPTLVPDDDKRPEIGSAAYAAADFEA